MEENRSNLGRIALLLFGAAVLLLLAWLGLKGWRLYQTSSSLLSRQDELQALNENGWKDIDPDVAESLMLGVRSDIATLNNELKVFLPLVPLFKPVPRLGDLVEAAPHLMEMADAGTEAAAYGIRAMKPLLEEIQNDEETAVLPVLLTTVANSRPDLAKASLALDRASIARANIHNIEALPWRVRSLIEKADMWLPIGQEFSRLTLALPELMGMDGPRRYLILAQNQDELRPTGGFISGAGYLQLENGEITQLEFIDANLVDAWEHEGGTWGGLLKPYDSPPSPLQDFMLLDIFLFRDSNFWPDFPVSGQKAMDFFVYGQDAEPLDGAIGINQQFLQELLRGTGPVKIADTGQVVNSNNLTKSLQESWTLQEGVNQRKAFLGPFAEAIQRRIDEGLGEIDPLYLIFQINQTLDQKDLQIYVRDPETATILAANGWDGRMAPVTNGDALMIVDTNVGYNKANFFIDRSATYDVRLTAEGESDALLEITHDHTGERSEEECWQGVLEEYQEGAPYLALTDKCYWNYLRIYAPQGSQLISGPDNMIPGQTWFGGYDWQPESKAFSELPGYTTFDSWMLVPRGEEHTSVFHYALPDTVIEREDGASHYTLRVLKQSGILPYHVQVLVTLPPGKKIIETIPDPVAVEKNTYIFAIELDSDKDISVTYR